MGEGKAAPGRMLSVLSFAAMWPMLLLGGCLPQSDSGEESGGKSSVFGFADAGDGGGVNRSEKADPLLRNVVAAATENLLEAKPATPRLQGGWTAASVETSSTQTSVTVAETPAPAPAIADTPAPVALGGFFRALSALETGNLGAPVTVLHLGDSHIAADRFSGDMRDQLQSRFGNAGRGLLMPGIYLARGVKFEHGGKWQTALSTDAASGSYGLTGVKVTAKGREDWLRVTASDGPFGWAEVTLQSGPDQGSALIALDGETKLVTGGGSGQSWKSMRFDKAAREILIKPKGDGPVTVHGITVGQEKPGVRYVNLGLPGATALTPLTWQPAQIADDMKRIGPNLIVIGYGTEESFNDGLNLQDYEAKVNTMLSMLRQTAPQASLLVIGPPDVARLPNFANGTGRASDVCRALSPQERAGYTQRIRSGDMRLARWHPPLKLEDVRTVLRRAAATHRAYFWDWSKLMGGACGIHAWVHSDPPLAASDHIHLTEEGSKRSARLLFRELMAGYDAYDRAVAASDDGWKPAVTQSGAVKGR